MNDLKGEKITIGDLLAPGFFFRVPEYQRPFSWDTDNFDDLIDDIVGASKDQEYFLGTIVLHKNGEKSHFDLVDGQQRITSLLILLACLRDILESEDHKAGIQTQIVQSKNVVKGIPEKVRLEVKDRQVFTDLVVTTGGTLVAKDINTMPEPEWRYAQAVDVFRSKLLKLPQMEVQRIAEFISQKCVVIYLSTPDFDDAFRLFTIVNDRGKQLRRIDVLKALNLAPEIITSDSVRNRVAQEWEVREKALGEATFETVFHFIRLIFLKDKPQGDLLKEFETRILNKNTVAKGEPFFNLIFEYADLYEKIFVVRTFIEEGSTQYNRFLGLMSAMDSEFRASEWRACLLSYGKKFGTNRFYDMVLKMEKVYLQQWVQGVRKDERYAEYARILNLIQSSKKADVVIDQVDADLELIKNAALKPDLYSAGYGKYFLLRLELVTTEYDTPREFAAKSVEHVLPQKPQSTGYWAEHHDLSNIESYVNKIGNLVLLSKSKNSSARNFDFKKKKEKYLKDRVSDYPRSLQVLSYADWTKDIIEKRTTEAAGLIVTDP